MLKVYCTEHHKDWDVGLPFLLFAARASVEEALWSSPNELVFGNSVRGPFKLIKDKWLSNKENGDVCKYAIDLKNKLAFACKTAKSHLLVSQDNMKRQYDRKSVPREFDVGDQVWLLLPLPGYPLKAKYQGPFQVVKKVRGLNYVVATPGVEKRNNCVT